MSEPRRLIEEGDAFEASLLRAARAFTPPEAGRAKTLAALGLAAGAAGAVGAGAASVAAGGKLSASAAAGKGLAAWLVRSTAGKIVLSTMLAGLVGVGVIVATRGPRVASSTNAADATSATPFPSSAPATPASTSTAWAAAPVASASSASPASSGAPASLPSARTSASAAIGPQPGIAPSTPSAPSTPKPNLAGEAALLDRARAALGAGDPSGAIAALDEHRKGYARPMLGIEATVLRIDALSRLGDRARARSLGEAFLAQHPDSPHAARVRSLIGEKDAP